MLQLQIDSTAVITGWQKCHIIFLLHRGGDARGPPLDIAATAVQRSHMPCILTLHPSERSERWTLHLPQRSDQEQVQPRSSSKGLESVNGVCTSSESSTYVRPLCLPHEQQLIIQEDTYTDALSHIITRDFFPNLPHVHATNAYLTALTNNDPELLSSSIRRLAQLAQEKEDGVGRAGPSGTREKEEREAKEARRRELENMGTPYISVPGGGSRRAARTPIGARGWDTPDVRGESSRRRGEDFDELDGAGETPGPSQPKKKRKQPAPDTVRDDLTLDAFQRNYTSEDNASFVQIVDKENQQRREDRWGWAWEVERKAKERRLEGEARRKMILDTATNGEWRVNAEGKRLIGGLAEGGRDRAEGEVWKEELKLVTGGEADAEVEGGAAS